MQKTIDGHWHLYVLEDDQGRDIRQIMDAYQADNQLDAFNICSIPVYNGLGPAQNLLAAVCKLHNRNAYAYCGLVYPQCPFEKPMPDGMDPLSQYRELMQIGFDGIKMLETKPTEQKAYGFFIDDPYFESLFAACEDEGTHMVWHVADPDTFWDIDRIPKRFLDRGWFYGDGTYMSYERTYEQVLRVLEAHPQLNVTFAHFFFWSGKPQQLEELFAKYPGVRVDLTPGAEMYADFRENRGFYREFFIRNADRIQFGTDTSFNGGDMERFGQRLNAVRDFICTDHQVTVITESCQGLQLPQEVCDKILYRNFEKVAGEKPKTIDTEALQAYFDKYKHLIYDQKLLAFLSEEIEKL